jgi:RHS repeat-associated protein
MVRFADRLCSSAFYPRIPLCLQNGVQGIRYAGRVHEAHSTKQTTSNFLSKLRTFALTLSTAVALTTIAAAQLPTGSLNGIQLNSTNNFGIDLANSNIHISIPLRSKSGPYPVGTSLELDSHINLAAGTPPPTVVYTNQSGFGPYLAIAGVPQGLGASASGSHRCGTQTNDEYFSAWKVFDSTGVSHGFSITAYIDKDGCLLPPSGLQEATDGSGWGIVFTHTGSYGQNNYVLTETIYDKAGDAFAVSGPGDGGGPFGSVVSSVTTPSGYTVNISATSGIVDGLSGTAVLTGFSTNNAALTTSVTYRDASDNPQTFTPTFNTNASVVDTMCAADGYDQPSGNKLLTGLTTPIGDYAFSYDATGRLSSITLPSGGSISYEYLNGSTGVNCTSGAVPVIQVTVNDNIGHSSVYTYTNTNGGGYPQNFTVTKLDQAGNQTVYSFSGEYQTQAVYYQGTSTILESVLTCYNGNVSDCAAPLLPTNEVALPITETDVRSTLGTSAARQVTTTFDAYGNPLVVAAHDFGGTLISPSGALLSVTTNVYGQSFSSATACNAYGSGIIFNTPCYTHTGPTSSSDVSETKISYNANGTRASVSRWTGATENTWLTTYFGYGGTNISPGALSSVTDVNGAVTSYGSFTCNEMLPTTTTYPLSLTGSQSWDPLCNGVVTVSSTDANQNSTTYTYTDPVWRMTSVTNQNYPATNFEYGSPTEFRSYMDFNGSVSTVDITTTTDGLGRPILMQKLQGQGSSSYDSVQYQYGWTSGIGAFVKQSMPYSTSPSAWTTTQYDALGRPSTVTDGGGGTVTYAYKGNDVLQSASSPSVQKQFEYDGLGRLSSVCEINSGTTAWPNVACGQVNSGLRGYWTTYSHDALGNLTGINQDVLGSVTQSRTYSYDGLARLTKEINPESGTTQYFWDNAPSACGSGGWSTLGDLGAKEDNAGVYTCNNYDALHRLLGVLYAPSSTCSGFVYDSATSPGGFTPTNTKGLLINAYTNSACNGRSSLVTDTWFGYSPRGETTDIYSSTLNSAGYYHVAKTYWANGAVDTLSGIPGVPTITYSADGEGRPSTVTAGSENLVTSALYNAASQVTTLNFASGDQDAYGYDGAGRMNSYTFTVGGRSVVGTPLWNTNGTLQTLDITDPFNSANQQNCSYGFDALARASSVSCNSGAAWGQSFAYDPFGNISKSVPSGATGISWLPGYNESSNRYSLGGTSYDGDGRLTNDTFHTYQWDPNGHALVVTSPSYSSTQTFDAMGNMAEQTNLPSFNWTAQYLRDEQGKELGWAQAQSAGETWIPLPGGATAVYVGSSLQNYWHADWLGSARFGSTPGRTLWSDQAYAPFGEPYAATGSGSDNQSFAGLLQNLFPDLYDTQNREYHPTQGRWITPDPAGFAAVDPTNPQSWNRYAYALNNPLSFKDPTGLECVWDDGSYDSNDDPDTGSAGSCSDAGGSWVDHSYFQQNGLADWSGDPNADIYSYAQNFTTTVTATPCSTNATLGQRVTAGIQGTLNVGLGETKTLAYGTLGVAGVAGAPETGGVSLLATAAAGYGIVTSQGQVASGMGQLVTAFSGNLPAGQGIQQVGDIMAGPIVGVPTLVATQNPATAQRAANYESFFTAGSGLVNSKNFTEALQGAVDFGLSAIGLAGEEGCN